MKIIIHTDGGARGNPGPAAVGVVIEEASGAKKKELVSFGKKIGETTNNVAEYSAVIEALRWITSQRTLTDKLMVELYLDSTLVVNQLNGLFKVKDAHLRELLTIVRVLEQDINGDIQYAYIPREKNTRADFLVNISLDKAV